MAIRDSVASLELFEPRVKAIMHCFRISKWNLSIRIGVFGSRPPLRLTGTSGRQVLSRQRDYCCIWLLQTADVNNRSTPSPQLILLNFRMSSLTDEMFKRALRQAFWDITYLQILQWRWHLETQRKKWSYGWGQRIFSNFSEIKSFGETQTWPLLFSNSQDCSVTFFPIRFARTFRWDIVVEFSHLRNTEPEQRQQQVKRRFTI